jgi:hypothetical protein
MQNYFLTFKGTIESETDNMELVCKNNVFNEIVIYMNEQHVCLDKITAVRLQRELKRLIGSLTDEGGNSGLL